MRSGEHDGRRVDDGGAARRDLASLRAEVDALNARLVADLDARARVVRAIATWKRAHGEPPLDPAREAAMLARVRAAAAADGYGPDALERVFRAVLAESRAIVERGDPAH